MGLAVLLWGMSTTVGQEIARCEPCDPCGGNSGFFTLTFGGWVESGIYTNNRNKDNNGPMHPASHARTDFQMNQLYLFGEKEMDTKHGFDWGGRADLVYGTDASGMQCFDQTFDADWGNNRHGYGLAAYQLYGTLGYKDLSVKIGKFITPIGWEEAASKNNIFYSHSYCYWIEPATHSGALATYDWSDRLSVSAGWTTGMDSSFKNPGNNSAVLSGITYLLSDDATVYYWISAGKQSDEERADYFVQSLCLEWALTDRFTYVHQYNLRNDNNGDGRYSSYGINNHFLYKLTDKLTAGTRVEWLRDNGGFGYFTDEPGDYWQVTLGLRWNPSEHLSVRPEVRYDCYRGSAAPFAGSHDQVSGGCGMLLSF